MTSMAGLSKTLQLIQDKLECYPKTKNICMAENGE